RTHGAEIGTSTPPAARPPERLRERGRASARGTAAPAALPARAVLRLHVRGRLLYPDAERAGRDIDDDPATGTGHDDGHHHDDEHVDRGAASRPVDDTPGPARVDRDVRLRRGDRPAERRRRDRGLRRQAPGPVDGGQANLGRRTYLHPRTGAAESGLVGTARAGGRRDPERTALRPAAKPAGA